MSSPTPNQSRILWTGLTVLAITLIVACVAALVWSLGRALHLLSPVIWPLAVAAALAYLLDPVVDWLEKRKMKRQRAIICVFAIAILAVAGIGVAVVPRLVIETRELAGRVPEYTRRLQQRVVVWLESKSDWNLPSLGSKAATSSAGTNTAILTGIATNNIGTNVVSGAAPAGAVDWESA
ncbi:MAG TPA: AI-2E family transporter, partial [Candidatus Limnocylindria bacterium]|nr:AI-2E family transporter [Candidatus Limnocylindria bacterium]